MVAPDREYILIVIQDIIRRLLQADAAGPQCGPGHLRERPHEV